MEDNECTGREFIWIDVKKGKNKLISMEINTFNNTKRLEKWNINKIIFFLRRGIIIRTSFIDILDIKRDNENQNLHPVEVSQH